MVATSPGSPASRKLDALDFEVTDFNDARKALDELPPGVAELERLRGAEKPPAAAKKPGADPQDIARAKALLEAAGYRVIAPR